ncbi:cytochrome P450 [Novosphingobium marinum]|uniref:Cytochrome P450 n=1 Tax=Novosphingobium marinum TaxID=1514948 RepID=A0A7Y9XZT9_9SPHN|nr:cytochrome P450 [Novosphingobium marinum]NYH96001.1 cytochrome P450 [Novosphingobium marinum]GGC31662.1 cytochrome P450 [Novosphingobium marinum]
MEPVPDLMKPEVQACPYALYDRLRREAPVYRMPATGFHLVTSYALCEEVIRQPDLFASEVSPAKLRPGGVPAEVLRVYAEEGWMPRMSCSTSDPPRHTEVRALLARLFTVAKVREMTPWMEETAGRLIDGFADRGECEFVGAFAHPLPMMVIAQQLGVPTGMIETFKRWSDAIVEPFSMMISEEREVECARLVVEMQQFFMDKVEDRRAQPKDDLLTTIATARGEDGEYLADEDTLTIIAVDLLASGNETTTAAIASGMQMLARDADLARALVAEPDRIANFAEEVLRLESPAQGMFRRVTRPTELGGVALKTGDLLSLRFGAANRDGDEFPHADRIDLDRKSPGRHLAFGIGRHHCIGAPLARQELVVSFSVLLRRLAEFSLACAEEELRYTPSFFGRNLEELPIRFGTRG